MKLIWYNISGPINEYCVDTNDFQVIGQFNHPNGFGSLSYTAPPASFSTILNSSSGLLIPQDVGTHTLQYVYTSNISGCQSDTSETILIHDLPVLSFNLASNFCTNDSSVMIVGNQVGGSFDGNVTAIFEENYLSQDTIDFIPTNTTGGIVHTFTYSYTDANSCFNSVDSTFNLHVAPTVEIDSDTLRAGYCELTDPSYPVSGLINGVNVNDGYFWGPGIVDVDSTDGVAQFITNNVAVGTGYPVYYMYTDANNCFDVDSAFVDVYQLPVVSIFGITPSHQYCNNHDIVFNPQQFIGTPQITAGLSSGVFVLDTVTTNADQSIFDPTIYTSNILHTIPISYTHTDEKGCINIAEDTVYVNPAAHPNFSVSGLCIVDSITYTDQTITPPLPDSLQAWTWTIKDSVYYSACYS